ncbi:putative metal homeostasis protein [Enterococcus sp. MJM12]|uniref:Metal homeostasis protein n=1 Tax=Candidatus Enterococcus myersii TaxID=2815322 RepID=A0ABS3HB65_9ENTE|nr:MULTISPECIES: putative metal homeostasis protein [Enterococcus]MBO0450398.1 putative metal homeostasis protein [Enterococcus sp. MJM12]MCD1024058.1 putative metal homeostasis protein [Enterococcus sp. SMC-9]MDT2739512.1 putative metal homeostasis protein [Enterococcus canintestini]WHA09962.1 putative metal homeostasis protein [Enterococcus montenegrensis]
MEKTDLASAYRRLKSPNIKTRKRALKIIKEYKRDKIRAYYAVN